MNFWKVFLAGLVRRWHCEPHTLAPENVAEHSWLVAMFIARLHPNPPAKLLMAALTHDLGEHATGDVPYFFKKVASDAFIMELDGAEHQGRIAVCGEELGGILADLDEESRLWLGEADLLAALYRLAFESQLGNKFAETQLKKHVMLDFQLPKLQEVWAQLKRQNP